MVLRIGGVLQVFNEGAEQTRTDGFARLSGLDANGRQQRLVQAGTAQDGKRNNDGSFADDTSDRIQWRVYGWFNRGQRVCR
jgi:hypothetical protein